MQVKYWSNIRDDHVLCEMLLNLQLINNGQILVKLSSVLLYISSLPVVPVFQMAKYYVKCVLITYC
jgi:hypothetical protein